MVTFADFKNGTATEYIDIDVPDGYEFVSLKETYALFKKYGEIDTPEATFGLCGIFDPKLPYKEGQTKKFTCEACGGSGYDAFYYEYNSDIDDVPECPACKGHPEIEATCHISVEDKQFKVEWTAK